MNLDEQIDGLVINYRAEKKTISRAIAHKMLKRDIKALIAEQVKQARANEVEYLYKYNLMGELTYKKRIAELQSTLGDKEN